MSHDNLGSDALDIDIEVDEAAFARDVQVRRGPTPLVVILAVPLDTRSIDRLRTLSDLRNGRTRQWTRDIVLRVLPDAISIGTGRDAVPGAFRCCFRAGESSRD